MDSYQAAELVQQAIWQVLLLAAPVLITGLVVGLVIGIFQSFTQIQDHTLGFVPKMIAILVVICLCLPWLFETMSEYSSETFEQIPGRISEGEP